MYLYKVLREGLPLSWIGFSEGHLWRLHIVWLEKHVYFPLESHKCSWSTYEIQNIEKQGQIMSYLHQCYLSHAWGFMQMTNDIGKALFSRAGELGVPVGFMCMKVSWYHLICKIYYRPMLYVGSLFMWIVHLFDQDFEHFLLQIELLKKD